MIYFINLLITLILTIFSLSFLPSLGIFDAAPLLPAFFVIALSYFRKGFEPVMLAALSGIIFDFMSPYTFGYFTFIFLGGALLVRIMFQEGMKELSFFNYILWSFVVVITYSVSQIVILYTQEIEIVTSIISPILITIITNMFFAFLLYFGVIWYFDKIKVVENKLKSR